jgi:hypothetical protein
VPLTLLGWVGLSVLGTLFTLWPTTTGTRITDGTISAARRALPTLAAGLLVADRERCRQAGIPDDVTMATKPFWRNR